VEVVDANASVVHTVAISSTSAVTWTGPKLESDASGLASKDRVLTGIGAGVQATIDTTTDLTVGARQCRELAARAKTGIAITCDISAGRWSDALRAIISGKSRVAVTCALCITGTIGIAKAHV